MNEIEKIGMYSTDEILEFMTRGEGRGFLGRSMFDAMYFKIKDLQSKIDKVIEYLEEKYSSYAEEDEMQKDELLKILKEDK
jgi:hypothetical protein